MSKINKFFGSILLLVFAHFSAGFTLIELVAMPSVKITKYSIEHYFNPDGSEISLVRGETKVVTSFEPIRCVEPVDEFLKSLLKTDKIEHDIPPVKKNHFALDNLYIQSNTSLSVQNKKEEDEESSDSQNVFNYATRFGNIKIRVNDKVFEPKGGLFFLDYIQINKGEKVIDIGTGSGILGIAAAKAGAEVYATDVNTEIINLAQYNAKDNGVTINVSAGSYFADYSKEDFDVIIANLPQEIIPRECISDLGDCSVTLDRGSKGNEVLMDFLDILPRHMNEFSRAYIGVYTLSYYFDVIQKISSHFQARLLGVKVEETHNFVSSYEQFYSDLNANGNICLFKRDGEWKAMAYIFELRKIKT